MRYTHAVRYFAIVLLFSLLLPQHVLGEEFVTRAAGFHLLFEPLKRPAEKTSERPYTDVPKDHPDHDLLTFAKARGIITDGDSFYPDEPLRFNDALIMLFRTRNLDAPDDITYETIGSFTERYSLPLPSNTSMATVGEKSDPVAREELMSIMNALDSAMKNEIHSVSFYSDDFAGDHTAFGEIFDPNALTAAHPTLPWNTLVKVTNQENGKSVIVRVNDRGPFVAGRSMDLARAAFEKIASLSSGVLHNVTLERLGNAEILNACPASRYQRRLGATQLTPGIPNIATVGTVIELTGDNSFRLIQMRKPNAPPVRSREWTEELTINFDTEGVFTFILHEDGGSRRRFRTKVIGQCS